MQSVGGKPAEVHEDLIPIWRAWHEISEGRQIGMAMSGLAWAEMSRYCEDVGVHGEQRLRWCRLMRAMDRAALAHWNRRKEKPPEAKHDGHPGPEHRP